MASCKRDIRYVASQNKQAQIPTTPLPQRSPSQLYRKPDEPNNSIPGRHALTFRFASESHSTDPPTSSPDNIHDYSDLGFILRSIDHDEAFRKETFANTEDWAAGQGVAFTPTSGNHHGGI
ncbi:MAG: hypothetical protein Q9188_007369 [Gyalolechia gomerana]